MRAWVSHDAKALLPLSHPELISRMRSARIIQSYLEDHPAKRTVLKSGSDKEVVTLMCEALETIVPPRDGRFVYEDRYVGTTEVGDLALVTFESSVKSAGSSSRPLVNQDTFVLKRKDGQWLFLWSIAVSIHVDLDWDPRP